MTKKTNYKTFEIEFYFFWLFFVVFARLANCSLIKPNYFILFQTKWFYTFPKQKCNFCFYFRNYVRCPSFQCWVGRTKKPEMFRCRCAITYWMKCGASTSFLQIGKLCAVVRNWGRGRALVCVGYCVTLRFGTVLRCASRLTVLYIESMLIKRVLCLVLVWFAWIGSALLRSAPWCKLSTVYVGVFNKQNGQITCLSKQRKYCSICLLACSMCCINSIRFNSTAETRIRKRARASEWTADRRCCRCTFFLNPLNTVQNKFQKHTPFECLKLIHMRDLKRFETKRFFGGERALALALANSIQ